jgi:hypothetical protein
MKAKTRSNKKPAAKVEAEHWEALIGSAETKPRQYRSKFYDPRWHKRWSEAQYSRAHHCDRCGVRKARLTVLIPGKVANSDPWDISTQELAVLCDECVTRTYELRAELVAMIHREQLQYEAVLSLLRWAISHGVFESFETSGYAAPEDLISSSPVRPRRAFFSARWRIYSSTEE